MYFSSGPRVWRIGTDGRLSEVAYVRERATVALYGKPRGEASIWGLAIAPNGAIYAATPSNGKVYRFEGAAEPEVVATGDDGWQATGVAEAQGHILVLESKTVGNSNFGPRVRSISPNKRSTLLGLVDS